MLDDKKDKHNRFKVKPAMEYIRYSEPKIITYLGIGILIGIIFIISVFYLSSELNKKVDRIDKRFEQLSTDVMNNINSFASTIECERETLNVLLDTMTKEVTDEVHKKE